FCKPYFRILAQDSLHDHVAGLFKHKFSQLPVNLMNCISHVGVQRGKDIALYVKIEGFSLTALTCIL
ncbi:hypothetical protein RB620_02485, partial [Paenibacillus sp. LHD-117]|uniref:hypothetical protein n=1 Tax=Paenibacillus sp. LHD-117 TaxID=3071412 RepID=UPI0027DF935D